jgi:CRISPR system Cascade subunit CasD
MRLEGPLQAWGDHRSKFVVRSSASMPTKSGVLGLICAAMGLDRDRATERLPELRLLRMAVRIDRAGWPWWDYHVTGAGIGNLQANGEVKYTAKKAEKAPGGTSNTQDEPTAPDTASGPGKAKRHSHDQPTKVIEPFVTRREYLADASFVVALEGDPALVDEVRHALANPEWPIYLGRKSCPPGRPLIDEADQTVAAAAGDMRSALAAVPWYVRFGREQPPAELECWVEWRPTQSQPEVPEDAFVWYDEPVSFAPPVHDPRFVVLEKLTCQPASRDPLRVWAGRPLRPRADYHNAEYRRVRAERMAADAHLCVVCKMPATTVQHITYRHAGGGEKLDELRSVCRLCHDAITMIEYGENMGLERIDPCDERWRERIIATRQQIIIFRSEEKRRRLLYRLPEKPEEEVE